MHIDDGNDQNEWRAWDRLRACLVNLNVAGIIKLFIQTYWNLFELTEAT